MLALSPSRIAAAAVTMAAAFVAPLAFADLPSAADRDTARRLMSEGQRRRELHDLPGALEAFRAADAIMGVPTTGLEVAKTEAALGHLVEAADVALRVVRIPPQPNEPALFGSARDLARGLSADLKPRIPQIRVQLRGRLRPTIDVRIDGRKIPNAALIAPQSVNPGHHVVLVMVGANEKVTEVDISEAETKSVAFDVPEDVASPTAGTAAPGAATTGVEPRSLAASPSSTGRALTILGVAVAGLGVAAGSVTGLLSVAQTSSIKAKCSGTRCPPSTYGDLDTAETMATASNVAFVVGGVGLGVALAGLFWPTGAADAARAPRSGGVTPWIGAGTTGLSGTF